MSGLRYFRDLRQYGVKSRSGAIKITAARSDVAFPCVCFAIGRRVGGAVVRNRLRRRLRVVFADHATQPGVYLIHADKSAVEMSFEELNKSVRVALESLGDLK